MKRVISLLIAGALVLCGATTAFAEDLSGEAQNWSVTFTANAKMEETYTAAQTTGDTLQNGTISDTISQMQPGDTVTFHMELVNQHAQSTDWYMVNDVLRSLERAAEDASGGAYTYQLTYTGPTGTVRELYNNTRVGGETDTNTDTEPEPEPEPSQEPEATSEPEATPEPEAAGNAENARPKNAPATEDRPEGLEYATSALGEEFFYLDTLASGQRGQIDLTVALDGETQGNTYQDTLAQLTMQFGVELTPQTTVERHVERKLVTTTQYHYSPVKTGDQSKLLLWSLVMLGCGIAALVLAVVNHRRSRRERR